MKSKVTYKGLQVVPEITADDEMGYRAIARMSSPAFMDGVPAGLVPVRLFADTTDWSVILEYEDEPRNSAVKASGSNLKSVVRDALALLGFDIRHRLTHGELAHAHA